MFFQNWTSRNWKDKEDQRIKEEKIEKIEKEAGWWGKVKSYFSEDKKTSVPK